MIFRPGLIIGVIVFALNIAIAKAEVTLTTPNYVIVAPDKKIAAERKRELEWSARIFEILMGQPPPRGRIVFSENPPGSVLLPGGRGAVMTSSNLRGAQPSAKDGTQWAMSWFATERIDGKENRQFSAVTHEAAHLQLIHTVNASAAESLKRAYNGYGAFLPDWLDEAVAVFHEPHQLKESRRAQFKVENRIPLQTFFTMSHMLGAPPLPESVQARSLEEAKEKIAALRAQRLEALKQAGTAFVKNAGEANRFYTQSLAMIEYFAARGGLPFVRYVIAEQNQGKSMDEVLVDWLAKQREIALLRAAIEAQAKKNGDQAGASAQRIAGILVRKDERANAMPITVNNLDYDFVYWIQDNYPQYRPKLPAFPGKWFGF